MEYSTNNGWVKCPIIKLDVQPATCCEWTTCSNRRRYLGRGRVRQPNTTILPASCILALVRHPTPAPVVLVGFMGSGKSTIGAALAARLGLPFQDLDAALEASSGRSIVSWFETQGEAAFRMAERAELQTTLERMAADGAGGVIALGGGAYAESATQALLAGRAWTVWLDVPLATIRTRIGEDGGRPLYGDATNVARLFAARQAAYARADARIDATDSPDTIVERIVEEFIARFGPHAGGS